MNASTFDGDMGTVPGVAHPPTHKLRLLLKREFWEHKGGFFWAPLVAGGISLLLTIMA
jgi:ABC-2 type transport system permease protein